MMHKTCNNLWCCVKKWCVLWQVCEAYAVLKDPVLRSLYNRENLHTKRDHEPRMRNRATRRVMTCKVQSMFFELWCSQRELSCGTKFSHNCCVSYRYPLTLMHFIRVTTATYPHRLCAAVLVQHQHHHPLILQASLYC